MSLAIFQAALAAHQSGDLDRAEGLYRQLLAIQPGLAEAHANLAVIQLGRDDTQSALTSVDSAIRISPTQANFHRLLGDIRMRRAEFVAASHAYSEAIRLAPSEAHFYYLLGCSLQEQRELNAAIHAYTCAIDRHPQHADAFNNLGIAYQEQGQFQQAIHAYRQSVDVDVRHENAWTNLGVALQATEQFPAARRAFQQALQLNATLPPAWNGLGNLYLALGQLTDAVACFSRLLQLVPNDSDGWYNLALAYHGLEQGDRARQCYARAAELSSKYSPLLALTQSLHHKDWSQLEAQCRAAMDAYLIAQRNQSVVAISPFLLMTLPMETSHAEQLEIANYWVAQTLSRIPRIQIKPRVRSDKIRLGYLSPDFRGHPAVVLVAELLESHARDRFQVYGYALGPPDASPFRQRIEKNCDRFIDLQPLALDQAGQQIQADQIDILIDLSGYARHTRAQILALHPAPVQVSFLGYPGTMGANFIDYILVDDWIVPPNQQAFYTEKLVHLPGSYQVNTLRWDIAETPSRAALGLPDDAFVFCCFNNAYKISPSMFRLWLRILAKVPNSLLWLLQPPPVFETQLRTLARDAGLDQDRLVMAPRQPLPEHFARHRQADLFLDCFPVNAHTTASDALRMGLPLVTLSGSTFISRVAGSLLRTMGLPELITTSFEEYEQLAIKLAITPTLLAEYRQRLVAQQATSSLFDAQHAARKIEAAFRHMLDRYDAGQPPIAFRVTDHNTIREDLEG